MNEERHDPWVKRLLLGFARTSEYNGPRKPGVPSHLIQEIDTDLPVAQPALQLTYDIFGSCPPMQSFDPAKLLTVSIYTSSTSSLPPLPGDALVLVGDFKCNAFFPLQDSGKLQTLDILLKRLRAENHRILLFAQMTKMLNILEVLITLNAVKLLLCKYLYEYISSSHILTFK